MKATGVFFGTSAFAVPSLRGFAQVTDCRLIVTQPGRPSGRGQRLQPTPVKIAAQELGIETVEPLKVRDALDRLREAGADLYATASYGKIIPQQILDLPRFGALNVHPSLLPLYRGATPLQAQLRDGVTEGGVTIILMDAGMDTGDILMQVKTAIGPEETYGELHDRLAELGASLLAHACEAAARGALQPTPQAGLADPEQIAKTATKPLTSSDLQLDWRWPAKRIVDFVRSLAPQPAARAELCGERIKILHASPGCQPRCSRRPLLDVEVEPTEEIANEVWEQVRLERDADALQQEASEAKPGTILGIVGDAALVACGDGVVAVERLVPANRASMDGRAFAQAYFRKPAAH